MEDAFLKILKGSKTDPPDVILKAFERQFRNVIGLEWLKNELVYEAVFYENEREKIASFNEQAQLIEVKENLPIHELPESVRKNLMDGEEIMNLILINGPNQTTYECIIRNKLDQRFLFTYSKEGEMLRRQVL